jgi:hypothetical protein
LDVLGAVVDGVVHGHVGERSAHDEDAAHDDDDDEAAFLGLGETQRSPAYRYCPVATRSMLRPPVALPSSRLTIVRT